MARNLPSYDYFPHPIYGVMDSIGAAFALGTAGGAAFHFSQGLVSGSPDTGRLVAGFRAARANSPRTAGTLSAYCIVLSAMEYGVSLVQGGRNTECGNYAAAAATFGVAGMRRGGLPSAARYVLYCAAGQVVMAEIHRASFLKDGADCMRQNQKNSDQIVAPVVLRPKPDGCR